MHTDTLKGLDPGVIIEFKNVYKAFGHQVVCRDLNLLVRKNKVLSILGPSGCGKTVTIKMLVGLEMADEGSILFDGMDIATFTHEDQFLPVRRRISMVFQGAALFDSLTVFDNIAYPLRVQNITDNDTEIADRVNKTLEMVGLPDAINKMPSELSGGMKKRIGLARAIVTEPEVILYDEPTAGLDPLNTHRIADLILLLQNHLNCTSMVITHDMYVVKAISDDVAFFYNGAVRQIGTYADLYNSKDDIVRGFVRGDPSLFRTEKGDL